MPLKTPTIPMPPPPYHPRLLGPFDLHRDGQRVVGAPASAGVSEGRVVFLINLFDELRRLAETFLREERPNHTLQATALVHEAYLRLVDTDQAQDWNSRGHFFAAAAEAMRRILVENARRKKAAKAGGGWQRQELLDDHVDAVRERHPAVAVEGGGTYTRRPLRGALGDPTNHPRLRPANRRHPDRGAPNCRHERPGDDRTRNPPRANSPRRREPPKRRKL